MVHGTTSSEDENDKAGPNPDNEGNTSPWTARKNFVSEAGTLLGYYGLEAYAVWPENHGLALASGVIGTGIVLLKDLSFKTWLLVVLTTGIIGTAIYAIIGPIPPPPPPAPAIGWLNPGDKPTPKNDCGVQAQGRSEYLLLAGTVGYVVTGKNKTMRAITLGWCRSLTIHSGDNGISIDAEVFGQNGKKIGEIVDNGYKIDGNLYVERSGDLSTIVVHDEDGRELIYVSFLNENTIKIRGNFYCPSPRPRSLILTNSSMLILPSHNTFIGGCNKSSKYGLVVQ